MPHGARDDQRVGARSRGVARPWVLATQASVGKRVVEPVRRWTSGGHLVRVLKEMATAGIVEIEWVTDPPGGVSDVGRRCAVRDPREFEVKVLREA